MLQKQSKPTNSMGANFDQDRKRNQLLPQRQIVNRAKKSTKNSLNVSLPLKTNKLAQILINGILGRYFIF